MKFHHIFTVFGLSLLTLMACQNPGSSQSSQDIYTNKEVNTGKVLARVGNTEIRQGILDTLSDMSPKLKSQLSNPLTKKKVVDSLVDQLLLYKEGEKIGLKSDEKVRLKSQLNFHSIVAQSLIENELEKEMKKAYEEKKETQFTKRDVSIIAIYFETDGDKKQPTDAQKQAALKKAQAIQKELKDGGDFKAIAKAKSDDKRTKRRGGHAGKVSKDDKRFARLGLSALVAPAFTLKTGEVSEPIAAKKGYYLVKANQDTNVMAFEDAKRVLGFELQNKIKGQLLKRLKKDYQVTYVMDQGKGKKAKVNPDKKPATKIIQKAKAKDDHAGHDHSGHDHSSHSKEKKKEKK